MKEFARLYTVNYVTLNSVKLASYESIEFCNLYIIHVYCQESSIYFIWLHIIYFLRAITGNFCLKCYTFLNQTLNRRTKVVSNAYVFT